MARGASNNGIREVLETDEVSEILRNKFFSTPEGGVPKVRAKPVRGRRGAALEEPEPAAELDREPTERFEAEGTPELQVRERVSRAPAPSAPPAPKAKPSHYKVICISMYTEDLAHLDQVVAELKRRGFTKANRSAVLRIAMEQFELDRVSKGL